jgi:hypothetical protein
MIVGCINDCSGWGVISWLGVDGWMDGWGWIEMEMTSGRWSDLYNEMLRKPNTFMSSHSMVVINELALKFNESLRYETSALLDVHDMHLPFMYILLFVMNY